MNIIPTPRTRFQSIALSALLAFGALSFAQPAPARAQQEDSAPAATAAPAETDAAPKAKPAGKKSSKSAAASDAKKSSGDKTAVIKTTAGDITVKLFADRAPKTVENFIGLATGKKEWTDPKSGKKQKGVPLYNGTIFHRVIPNFMIQGGDPLGQGYGGPGFQFEDETKPSDSFDHPGILAMANSGPNTNGSQFFITVAPTPHLSGRHTIFGEVTKGMDVVEKIVNAPSGAQDRPTNPVKIKSIQVK